VNQLHNLAKWREENRPISSNTWMSKRQRAATRATLLTSPNKLAFPLAFLGATTVLSRSQYTILALDDEADALEQLAEILSAAGYACRTAASGRDAAAAIRESVPDLIIADINLAGYNGMTVCEKLVQDAGLAHVPVMFLSSAQVPDIIRRSHTYFVRKPFDPTVLVELVAKALPAEQLTAV
jgi:CheY-like chemotaxis protein